MHSDYSDGPVLGWTDYTEGLLINPRMVLEPNQMGLGFLVYDKPITDEVLTVSVHDATHYQLEIFRGNSVQHMDVEKLAHMQVWELGEFITGTDKL
ncbi:hypothetical protein [Sporosarcina sp. ACRSL]|uniref:hypothetical protein n=1 Tax=Sporosarcina sp. ACRSL TaxID=2918215 RepID=UPI001EF3EB13|nr:hypothetical protein [Sporosarcina sp. ACRSL]